MSVVAYTIKAVGQDTFDDVIVPDAPQKPRTSEVPLLMVDDYDIELETIQGDFVRAKDYTNASLVGAWRRIGAGYFMCMILCRDRLRPPDCGGSDCMMASWSPA